MKCSGRVDFTFVLFLMNSILISSIFLVKLLLIWRANISWLSNCLFAKFNGLLRTVIDTGCAMHAVISPEYPILIHTNIIERTNFLTKTTPNAGVCRMEFLCLHKGVIIPVTNKLRISILAFLYPRVFSLH